MENNMNDQKRGLYGKFAVVRADGRDGPGEKHEHCEHFVLDLDHDKHALPAIAAYVNSCKDEFPQLAADLRAKVLAKVTADNEFVTVPDVTLPNGTVVPSFTVGKYLCSRGPMDTPQVNATAAPWVEISYHDARAACETLGGKLITELQYLAIAHDICQQDINWSGGKVGEGYVFQGLHLGTVDEPQPGDFISGKEAERRWHQLSNGERVFDFAGNAYSWVFDNVQGDEQGIVTREFAADSPSIATAPFPRREKGMGWRPSAGADWAGGALARGGCWRVGGSAGVFDLSGGSPGYRDDLVGFRCTK
jgi:formylglycine-generating enzyme required for sulfatase activity